MVKLSDIVQRILAGKCSGEDVVQPTQQYKQVRHKVKRSRTDTKGTHLFKLLNSLAAKLFPTAGQFAEFHHASLAIHKTS